MGIPKRRGKHQKINLVSYSLLSDFTTDYMTSCQTIRGFHRAYVAKCKYKLGMEDEDIITFRTWNMAVRKFWNDVFQISMQEAFICKTCQEKPPVLVVDGISMGLQVGIVILFIPLI